MEARKKSTRSRNVSRSGRSGPRLSRGRFIRATGIAAAGAAAGAIGLGGTVRAVPPNDPNIVDGNTGQPASGGEALIWVYPTGVESHDVPNVQWALQNVQTGGTVILKQQGLASNPLHFDFGTTGTVSITKSLTLQGEFTGQRKPLAGVGYGGWIQEGTTIKGGTAPVRVPYSGAPAGPSFAIKDIVFNSPRNRAIGCGTSSGYSEISGCKIVNLMVGPLAGAPTGAFWMIVHGGTGESDITRLTGTLRIRNNFFGKPVNPLPNSTEPDPDSLANGINNLMHVSNCELDLEISGNEVQDCVWGGLLVMLNKGYSVITRNKVNKTRSFFFGGMAIGLGVYPVTSPYFLTNYSYEGGAEVSNNEITIGSTSPDLLSTTNSSGITIVNYPPDQFPGLPGYPKQEPEPASYVVSGNTIQMHRNQSNGGLNPVAIFFGGAASNITCADNAIEGEAYYGIQLTRALPPPAAQANASSFVTNNACYRNDLRGFAAGSAQLSLDQYSPMNMFRNNDYGEVSLDPPALGGAYIEGSGNTFINENFWGDYPGINGTPAVACMALTATSYGNKVSAFKYGHALQGSDICTQISDATMTPQLPLGKNKITGYQRCLGKRKG